MESHRPEKSPNDLFWGVPAFAEQAIIANLTRMGRIARIMPRLSWWMTGNAILRDLPDYSPPLYVGRQIQSQSDLNDIAPSTLLLPTLAIICSECPANIDPEDGMDYIKGYAAGCELLTCPPQPAKSAARLWQGDIAARSLLCGPTASADEIEDPYCRDISVNYGDNFRSTGSTDNLTWSVADLVGAVSQIQPIADGTVISCGIAINHPLADRSGPIEISISGMAPLIISV